MHCKVVFVHVLPGQVQELVLVLPTKRLFFELVGFARGKRRFCDLGNEICCRGFCDTVDEDANKWDLDEDVEAEAETEKYASSIPEPKLLLLLGVTYACKVGLELTAG